MELEKLVTARLLVKSGTDKGNVVEVKLCEVSPSGEFARIKGRNGERWLKSAEIEVVEILEAQPL